MLDGGPRARREPGGFPGDLCAACEGTCICEEAAFLLTRSLSSLSDASLLLLLAGPVILARRTSLLIDNVAHAARVFPHHLHGRRRPAAGDARDAHLLEVHQALGASAVLPGIPVSTPGASRSTTTKREFVLDNFGSGQAMDHDPPFEHIFEPDGGGVAGAHLQSATSRLDSCAARCLGVIRVQLSVLGSQATRVDL